MARNYIQFITN